MIKTPTKEVMTKLITDLRSIAPKRPLSYGESLQVARTQAAHLRSWAKAEDPDIDHMWLAKQRVIPVEFVPNHRLMEQASGLTTNAIDNQIRIYLSEYEPETRTRFSLFHEFKHVLDFDDADVLHERLGSGNATRQSTQIELICNEFSAHVLMPFELVKRVWFRTQDIDLSATFFNVSPEAMSTRLTRLGLIRRPNNSTKHFFRPSGFIHVPDLILNPCAV